MLTMGQFWHRFTTSSSISTTSKTGNHQPQHATPPRGLRWRSSRPFIVTVVSFAIFTDVFLYGIIVPVAPNALEDRVGLLEKDRQRWTSILLALYGAFLLAASPVCGYFADKMASRKWPLIFGLLALAASTALLCVGTNLALWITGRIFQGISAAIVWTVGVALLVDTTGVHEVGSAMGFVGMSFSVGIMLGPLLGGVIYQNGGYYAVFGTTFAIIGVDVVLRLVMIETKDARKWLEHPVAEESKMSSDTALERGQEDSQISAEDETGMPAEGGEQARPPKRRTPSTFILLQSPRILIALFGYFVISVIMTGFDSVLPLFVGSTFGWGQSEQGLIFVALCLPHLLEPIWGRLGDRHKHAWRLFAAISFLANVPFLVLLRLVSSNTLGHKVLLCALLALTGTSLSLALPSVMTEVSHVMGDIQTKSPHAFGENGAVAQAYGLMNCGFAAGGLVGPVWAGFVRQNYGWGTMSWTLGLLSGVTAIPILLGLEGWIWKTGQDTRETVQN